MTKTEPVLLFSGLAATIGIGLHWLVPDAAIPDELIVVAIFGIAVLARRYVYPEASMPDAEILEHARRAVQRNRAGGGPSALCFLLVLLIPATAAANAETECAAAGGRWVHQGGSYHACIQPAGRDGRDGEDADPGITDALREDVDRAAADNQRQDGRLDEHGRRIAAGEEHDARQDGRLDEHGRRIAAGEEHDARQDGRLDRHRSVLRDHGSALMQHGAALDRHEATLFSHDARLTAAETRIGALDTRTDRLEAGLAAAMALSQIPFDRGRRLSIGIGFSSFGGTAAVAAGAQARIVGRLFVRGSLSRTRAGTVAGAGLGIGF